MEKGNNPHATEQKTEQEAEIVSVVDRARQDAGHQQRKHQAETRRPP